MILLLSLKQLHCISVFTAKKVIVSDAATRRVQFHVIVNVQLLDKHDEAFMMSEIIALIQLVISTQR